MPQMLRVTKSVKFDAAHILTNHQGLCKNLHGHTYRVETVVADANGASDMVIDFKDLKRVTEEAIVAKFDHAFMYNTQSTAECEIASVVEKYGMRTAPMPFRSTAENLARHFFAILKPLVKGLEAIRVWETQDSCAEYSERIR